MLFKTLLTLSACAAASLTLFRTHRMLRTARRVPVGIRAASAETGLFVQYGTRSADTASEAQAARRIVS